MVGAVAIFGALFVSAPLERRDVQCGAHSCYIALGILGLRVGSFDEFLRRLGPPGNRGYSLLQMRDAAIGYGAYAECIRCDLDGLKRIEQPFVCVPLLRGGHFVALVHFDDSKAWIADAPDYLELPRALLEARWPGEALVVAASPLPSFEPPTTSSSNWKWIVGGALVFVVALLGILVRNRQSLLRTHLVLFGLLLAGCSKRQSIETTGVPLAVVDRTSLDLGSFRAFDNTPPQGTFVIRNGGSGELRLSKVQLSCTCVDARLSIAALQPGQQANLDIRFRPGENAKQPSAQVKVTTNDPQNPFLQLTVQWEVAHDLIATPSEVFFPANDRNWEYQRIAVHFARADLDAVRDKPTLFFNDKALDARFEAKAAPTVGNKHYWGDIVLKPKRPPEAVIDTISDVQLFVPTTKDRVSITIRWQREAEFEASPAEVYMGVVKPGEWHSTKLVFRRASGPIRTLRLASGDLGLSDEMPTPLSPPSPTSTHVVELRQKAPMKNGVFHRILVFECNDGSANATVHVRGLVR